MTQSLSNTQRALQELRQRIFSGDLAAGSNHLETELADMLGMSRTPVREAALMLELQGLVELPPRKGVRILPISPEDMGDIYDILIELESMAAEKAALAGHDKNALVILLTAINHMDIAINEGDLEAWADADERFHHELVRLSGNRRAEGMVHMLRDQVRRARMTTLFMRPLPTKSNADHREVYDAILAGDAEAARRIHRDHRVQSKAMIVDLLEKHRLKYL